MEFNTINEAKEYVVSLTNKARTIENIDSAISYYQEMVDSSHSEGSRNLWLSELNELIEWKNSDDFKNGNYPQGIDDLILELVEWRSVIYSFQNVDTKRDRLKKADFMRNGMLGESMGYFQFSESY